MGGTGIKGNGEERGKRECMDGKGKEGNDIFQLCGGFG